ncbi:MAG: site-specific DNA-methyltransferase [Bacteroidia bacterium]|nr:site-specific DNA-methyltransferase [Bacteroidia bacterium]
MREACGGCVSSAERSAAPKRQRSPQHADPSAAKGHAQKNNLVNLFSNMISHLNIDPSWSFNECSAKDTSYITHGYYTYPAKFIPQLVRRLIYEHSTETQVLADPFMGSGTTIVEGLINQRISIGVDINEIAFLVAQVKTTPLPSLKLVEVFTQLEKDLKKRLYTERTYFLQKSLDSLKLHEKIDYWFRPAQKESLAILLQRILEISDEPVRRFFLVAFAQILKSCSIWLQKSVKPTRDLSKKDYDVLQTFLQHAKKMVEKNNQFCKLLPQPFLENIENYRIIACTDAREMPCLTESVDLIITSPPYVTSYEYADLHQLPLYWLGYLEDLSQFRQKFIGSMYRKRENGSIHSTLAERVIKDLCNTKKSLEVQRYFADMYEVFKEMHRILKPRAKACIIIGNTSFKGIYIPNAEVFIEQMQNLGFSIFDIVKREIPSKMLPSTRDSKTGQFAKSNQENVILAYPTEYILIFKKL